MSVQTLAGGRYRVERTVGQGGMAAVYLAHDEELDRPVAVKILAAHLGDDPTLRERFLREARMAARLSHPNIVQVFDAGDHDGSPFIVMEFVEGETLADVGRADGRVAPVRVVDLALQVCGGLEHAHAAGLVHRDIKPQNLLLRTDGVVKIADFGIARAAEATKLTQIGSVLGTAAYLAPEQASGDPVTAAADVYSLGVVLYELLAGRTPYDFRTLPELVTKQREEPIPGIREAAPDVPERLEAVVMRCLARNPEYRPASAAELAHELAAASPEPPTETLPAPTGVRATEVATQPLARAEPPRGRTVSRQTWALPRRTLIVLLALALIVVAIVVAVALSGNGESPTPATPAGVEPVQRSDDPAEQARNLADWLRDHSR